MPKEYEIKFGRFKNNKNNKNKNSKSKGSPKFESQVSKSKYYKILNLPLFNSTRDYSRTINLIDGDIRKTINLDRDNRPISEETITKTKVETTNYPNHNARLSVSNEKATKSKAKEGLVRYKFRITRYSDLLPDWRFDFTIANHFSATTLDSMNSKNSNNKKGDKSHNKLRSMIKEELSKSQPFYQVEAEYLKAKKPPKKEIDFIIEKFNSVNIIIELESLVKERINFHSFISQVKNLDLKTLVKLEGNYAVTDKADGERALIFIDHNGDCYSINKALSVTPLNKNVKDNHCSLVDSEMIDGTPYLFDCLIYKKKDLRNEHFPKRYEELQNFSSNWKVKTFAFKDLSKHAEKMWKAKHPYTLDGLIFTPLDQRYVEPSLKWKPLSMQTADFLIFKEKDEWILFAQANFHYIRKNRIKIEYEKFPFLDPKVKLGTYPIQFATTIPPKGDSDKNSKWPNLSIIEFKWEDDHWVPEKLRKDKTEQMLNAVKNGQFNGPNGINTIKSVIHSIKNPIKEEWLFGKEELPEVYYTGNNKGRSNEMRKFHNKIKSDLYTQFIKKGDNVLELASGRGGDLRKLAKIAPKRVVMTDIAKNGLQEAERRYEEMKEKNSIGNMKVDFIETNATTDITPLLPKRIKYQVVSIMFAFHYFIKSFETTIKNIDFALKKGGYLLLTTFDKSLITEMNTPAFKVKLKNKNKVYVYAESIGESNEYLVDYDWLIKEMEARKYKLVYNQAFKELYSEKNQKNQKMSSNEQQFSFMNRAVVFQKL